MSDIIEFGSLDDPRAADAADALEAGALLLFPRLPFHLDADEQAFLDPAILKPKAKNVSLEPDGEALGGTIVEGEARERLRRMMQRFSRSADGILAAVAPTYGPHLQKRRTSFRPGPVDTRVLSLRKDDRRLHVDAFPSSPVQGRRILRVFTNVNPAEDRVWEVGEDGFEQYVRSVQAGLKPRDGGAWRERLGLTKGRRTPYDSVMLQLHDNAKLDEAWQAAAAKRTVGFPPGSSWVVYTDGVLHAALAGQHAFEQTYLMPVEGLSAPEHAPVRVLERVLGRRLI